MLDMQTLVDLLIAALFALFSLWVLWLEYSAVTLSYVFICSALFFVMYGTHVIQEYERNRHWH